MRIVYAMSRAMLGTLVAAAMTSGCASGGNPPCSGPSCRDAGGLDAAARFDAVGTLDAPGGPDANERVDAIMSDASAVASEAGTDAFARADDAAVTDASLRDSAVPPADAGGIQRCPVGEAMTGRTGATPLCAPIAASVTSYVNQSCSIYFGWRDSCGGCSDPPTKWGRVSDASCETTGTDGTCEMHTLGASPVRLYGLNPDGDVDDNDKLYLGFRCAPSASGGPAVGNCPVGQYVTGTDATGAFGCAPVGSAAEDAVNDGCALYLGQRDSCSGCSGAPTKWGSVHGDACVSGAGSGGTCTSATLGPSAVTLFGLDLDGDVNDDDQIYLGLTCSGATATETRVIGACPPGTLATGLGGDGSLVCTSPALLIESTVNSQCFVYLGWRDSCDACSTGPVKWGRTNGAGTCESGSGVANVCVTSPTQLFGLNPDGDVGGDDKIYVGMHCF